MGRYRKIDSRIWNDEKFMSFSDSGKLAFLFILTHPNMTALGAMRASIPGMAAEMGWTEKAFREAFREASRKGCVSIDEKASCLLVYNFLRYNGPENPNVVKGWGGALDLIPECPIKTQVIEIARVKVESLTEAFREALPKEFIKPYRKPEPEPEPEPYIPPIVPQKGDVLTQQYSPGFISFWDCYPRKVGKDAAWRKWQKRKLEDQSSVICQSVEEHKDWEDWKKHGGEFIPHPATFLNQGRWQDVARENGHAGNFNFLKTMIEEDTSNGQAQNEQDRSAEMFSAPYRRLS